MKMEKEYVREMEPRELLSFLKQMLMDETVMHHPFLQKFAGTYLSREQLKLFAVQWYEVVRRHKEAFPAVIWNVKDDDIRFELIEILWEEYGNGDQEKIHAKLLMRFVNAVGVSEDEVDRVKVLPATQQFGKEVLSGWKDGDEAYALGLHFALEALSAAFHVHFANGIAQYEFLTDEEREHFDYHRIAEQRHSDLSENGILRCASSPANRLKIVEGAAKALQLMGELWDGFDEAIFKAHSDARAP